MTHVVGVKRRRWGWYSNCSACLKKRKKFSLQYNGYRTMQRYKRPYEECREKKSTDSVYKRCTRRWKSERERDWERERKQGKREKALKEKRETEGERDIERETDVETERKCKEWEREREGERERERKKERTPWKKKKKKQRDRETQREKERGGGGGESRELGWCHRVTCESADVILSWNANGRTPWGYFRHHWS